METIISTFEYLRVSCFVFIVLCLYLHMVGTGKVYICMFGNLNPFSFPDAKCYYDGFHKQTNKHKEQLCAVSSIVNI